MQPTATTHLVTCAIPTCAALVPVAESTYVDGAGQVCAQCIGPLPDWMYEIEPPF